MAIGGMHEREQVCKTREFPFYYYYHGEAPRASTTIGAIHDNDRARVVYTVLWLKSERKGKYLGVELNKPTNLAC
jgi:hypothetical protein